jgi:hypothetical protein
MSSFAIADLGSTHHGKVLFALAEVADLQPRANNENHTGAPLGVDGQSKGGNFFM